MERPSRKNSVLAATAVVACLAPWVAAAAFASGSITGFSTGYVALIVSGLVLNACLACFRPVFFVTMALVAWVMLLYLPWRLDGFLEENGIPKFPVIATLAPAGPVQGMTTEKWLFGPVEFDLPAGFRPLMKEAGEQSETQGGNSAGNARVYRAPLTNGAGTTVECSPQRRLTTALPWRIFAGEGKRGLDDVIGLIGRGRSIPGFLGCILLAGSDRFGWGGTGPVPYLATAGVSNGKKPGHGGSPENTKTGFVRFQVWPEGTGDCVAITVSAPGRPGFDDPVPAMIRSTVRSATNRAAKKAVPAAR